MDKSYAQAQETRKRNQEARAAMYEEQAASIRIARQALQRVLENKDATPAETLEAARLLVELSKY